MDIDKLRELQEAVEKAPMSTWEYMAALEGLGLPLANHILMGMGIAADGSSKREMEGCKELGELLANQVLDDMKRPSPWTAMWRASDP